VLVLDDRKSSFKMLPGTVLFPWVESIPVSLQTVRKSTLSAREDGSGGKGRVGVRETTGMGLGRGGFELEKRRVVQGLR